MAGGLVGRRGWCGRAIVWSARKWAGGCGAEADVAEATCTPTRRAYRQGKCVRQGAWRGELGTEGRRAMAEGGACAHSLDTPEREGSQRVVARRRTDGRPKIRLEDRLPRSGSGSGWDFGTPGRGRRSPPGSGLLSVDRLVGRTGLEPVTLCLKGTCSAIELTARGVILSWAAISGQRTAVSGQHSARSYWRLATGG